MRKIIPTNLFDLAQKAAIFVFFTALLWSLLKKKSDAKSFLPAECGNFSLLYYPEDVNTSKIVLLGDQHDLYKITATCMYALAKFLFHTEKVHVYIEPIYDDVTRANSEHYQLTCSKAISCASWDDVTAQNQAAAIFRDLYSDYYYFRTYQYFQNFSDTDANKYSVLKNTLKNKTALRDYFFENRYHPFHPTTLLAIQNEVLSTLVNFYEENYNDEIISDAQRNMACTDFFTQVFMMRFQYLRKTTPHLECKNKPDIDSFLGCHAMRSIEESSKPRDELLYQKIQLAKKTGKPTFFIAGNNHAKAISRRIKKSPVAEKNGVIVFEYKR